MDRADSEMDQADLEMTQHRVRTLTEEDDESCCNLSKRALLCLVGIVVCALVASAILGVVFGVRKWGQPPRTWNGTGTTPHFPEIILGRCLSYTQVKRPELRDKNCAKIVEAFMNAILSKDPCSSTEQDFQPLLKLTHQTLPCNKALFWSKSSELAHQYTRVQPEMFTLEDTLLGYMADGLTWCGDAGSSEVNYGSCPSRRRDCFNNTYSVFWDTVSKNLAENVCGVVHVVLNGSNSNTFDKSSTFGRMEIYNLNPEKVHRLEAWVMHELGDPSNSCSGASIKDLKQILSEKNIAFTCHSNYRSIRFLQCAKNSEHSSCPSLR